LGLGAKSSALAKIEALQAPRREYMGVGVGVCGGGSATCSDFFFIFGSGNAYFGAFSGPFDDLLPD